MAKAGAESLRATVAPEHLCSWQCASRVVDLKFLQKDIGVAWLEPTKSEALRKNSLCKVVTNTITGKSKKSSSLTQTSTPSTCSFKTACQRSQKWRKANT